MKRDYTVLHQVINANSKRDKTIKGLHEMMYHAGIKSNRKGLVYTFDSITGGNVPRETAYVLRPCTSNWEKSLCFKYKVVNRKTGNSHKFFNFETAVEGLREISQSLICWK